MPKNSGDYVRPLLGLAGLLFGTPVMILFFFVAYVVSDAGETHIGR